MYERIPNETSAYNDDMQVVRLDIRQVVFCILFDPRGQTQPLGPRSDEHTP